jgi:hypothetical protein
MILTATILLSLTGAWIIGMGLIVMTAAILLVLHHTPLGRLVHEHLPDKPSRRMFLASISFFLTFAGVRLLTLMIHENVGPFHDISMGGRHIHHLVWGILLLLLVGYGWLAEVGTGEGESSLLLGRLMSILYGAAAALTLDEFALWLNLRDVYWAREGRSSVDAAILFGALLSMGYWGAPLVRAVFGKKKN